MPGNTLEAGTLLANRYRIERIIGQGGNGVVYYAQDIRLNREVAVKVLLPDTPQDSTFLARFKREFEILKGLGGKDIVTIYDADVDHTTPYIIMPYYAGGTLQKYVGKVNPDNLGEVMKIFRDVARALDFAHSRDIIHRDVKPSNVLLDERDDAFLADFGIVKIMDTGDQDATSITGVGKPLGTPTFMSPEQWDAKELDHRTDIYSLAVTIYLVLTGVPVFEGSLNTLIIKHMSEVPTPVYISRNTLFNKDNPGVGRVFIGEVNKSLQKALAKLPDERYDSATAFIDDLEEKIAVDLEALESISLTGDTTYVPPRSFSEDTTLTEPASAPPWRWIGGIGGVIIVGLLLIFLTIRGNSSDVVDTPTVAPTQAVADAPTATATNSPTSTATEIPTDSPSATPAPTETSTPTLTLTRTPVPTALPTNTRTPSALPSPTSVVLPATATSAPVVSQATPENITCITENCALVSRVDRGGDCDSARSSGHCFETCVSSIGPCNEGNRQHVFTNFAIVNGLAEAETYCDWAGGHIPTRAEFDEILDAYPDAGEVKIDTPRNETELLGVWVGSNQVWVYENQDYILTSDLREDDSNYFNNVGIICVKDA